MWAQKLADTNTFEHSENGYGANLYSSSGMPVTGKTAVDSWYSGIEIFKRNPGFNNPGFSSGTGLCELCAFIYP